METDSRCVQRVLAGETELFRILVERHQTRMVGVLMRILCDPVEAEELAHDAFVKAFTKLSGFRGDAEFGTWLIQIGVNLARDRQRQQTRARNRGIVSLDALREQKQDRWEPADRRPMSNPAVELDGREKWQCFERALETIPPAFREVFTLRHLEDLSYDEIARLTGDSPGTLKVRNHRARNLLKNKMEAMGVSLATAAAAGAPRSSLEQEGT